MPMTQVYEVDTDGRRWLITRDGNGMEMGRAAADPLANITPDPRRARLDTLLAKQTLTADDRDDLLKIIAWSIIKLVK